MISRIKKSWDSVKCFNSPHSSASSPRQPTSPSGFTLLELLIVVSIIAILSVALVLVLDPAEALRKSRDSQRMSDLSTMKTALGIYLTSTTTPLLGGASNAGCKLTATGAYAAGDLIYYSGVAGFSDLLLDGSVTSGQPTAQISSTPATTDGLGWIPVPFDNLIGGSPISNLPVDPVNTIASASNVVSTDLVYRYACSITPLAFEIDAQLESAAYATTGSADNKKTTDGGNADLYYEVGTNLKILGTGASVPF
ncbi:MAG: hypothetical protein UY07_C0002G0048 [Parcubacteria group bacterium GW2011_GWA1_47_8]|nr:MAG: hypothetical protein UY07_C0002G0048 [Parcubacteria group bacterium GW2011_GWA1_47_8]